MDTKERVASQVKIYKSTHTRLKIFAAENNMSLAEAIDYSSKRLEDDKVKKNG